MIFSALLRRVLDGVDLTESESAEVIGAVVDETISPVQAAGLLAALAAKGECVAEVAGAARAMRERCIRVDHGLPLVADVVGTGGDGADTINISTLASLVVAAAGVPVAKHGNRAASSACGSADVLEARGLALDAGPDAAARMLREANFTYMYAPRYHPAMKSVGPVRSALGVRTIFNVLGPLTNPAFVTHQVVGVARPELLELVGDVLRDLGVRAGAVLHGYGGIDEVGGDGPAEMYSFDERGARRWTLDPAAFGVRASRADIAGGSIEACAAAFDGVLGGERSARSEVVALNAAVALHACRRTETLEEAFELARATLASGEALETFSQAKELSR